MSRFYLDASALVKRYVDEAGSDWLRTVIAPIQTRLLLTSRLTIVEVSSAFARRVRDGSLTPDEFDAAWNAFRGDCLHDYQIMPPAMSVVDQACALLARYSLRAYDAVHLASALGAQQFLTDQNFR